MTVYMQAVATATAGVPRLYALNSVPASPTYPYGVFTAGIGGGEGYTLDGSVPGLRLGAVTLQTFGKTADAAFDHMEKALAVLMGLRLASGCTPLQTGLDRPAINRDPDDNGVVTLTMPLTFTQEA